MIKRVIICLLFIFFQIELFSADVPEKPSSIPEKAVWSGSNWQYIDRDKKEAATWYKNGRMESKGNFITINEKDFPNGNIYFWGEDGTKIMEEYWFKGKKIQKINYRIDSPNIQRPLNIAPKAFWQNEIQSWAFFDKDESKVYMWYMNGEVKKMSEVDSSNRDLPYDGKTIEWYQNGKIKEEFIYEKGKLHGIQILRNETGEITEKSFYKNDKKVWVHQYSKQKSSDLEDVEFWDVGVEKWGKIKENIKINYYNEGIISQKTEMKGNGYNGKFQAFYKTGKLAIDGQYKDSDPDGIWIFYYQNGKKEKEKVYKDGKLISTKVIP